MPALSLPYSPRTIFALISPSSRQRASRPQSWQARCRSDPLSDGSVANGRNCLDETVPQGLCEAVGRFEAAPIRTPTAARQRTQWRHDEAATEIQAVDDDCPPPARSHRADTGSWLKTSTMAGSDVIIAQVSTNATIIKLRVRLAKKAGKQRLIAAVRRFKNEPSDAQHSSGG